MLVQSIFASKIVETMLIKKPASKGGEYRANDDLLNVYRNRIVIIFIS